MSGQGGAGEGATRGATPGASAAHLLSPVLRPEQLVDEAWLYNAPAFHNAVAWSEDNLLAVTAAHTVLIVSPADLAGARQYVALPQPERSRDGAPARSSVLRCHPRAPDESASLPLLLLAEGEAAVTQTLARAVAWSPAGCAPRGAGCMLAVLSSDRRLRLYGPGPTSQHARWELIRDLSDALSDHFEEVGWGDVDPPAAPPGSALRLRGGGRKSSTVAAEDGAGKQGKSGGKRQRAVAAEEGAQHHTATDEGQDQQPQSKRGRGRPRKNPLPQQEEEPAAGTAVRAAAAGPAVPPPTFAAGDAVEVMNDEDGLRGCWFTGRVSQLHGGLALVEYDELFTDEEGTMRLREWFPLPAPARRAARGPAGPLPGDFPLHEGDGYLMRPPPPRELVAFQQPPVPGVTLELLRDGGWWICPVSQVTATHVAAVIPGEPESVEVPLSDVRRLTIWDATTGAFGLAVPILDTGGAGAATGAVPSTQRQQQQQQQQGARASKPPARRRSPSRSPSPPTSSDAADGGASGRGRRRAAKKALHRVARATAGEDWSDDPGGARQAKVRRPARASDDTASTDWRASEEEEDTDDIDEDMQVEEDELVHEEPGAATDEDGWDLSGDERPGRARGRGTRVSGRRGRGGRGRISSGAGGDGDGDGNEDGSEAGEDREEEPWAFEEYEVPTDLAPDTFTRLCTQPLPTNEAGWTKAVPFMIRDRFVELREHLPPQQTPVYKKGQHLRNHDLRLLTQARAEFAALHGQAVAEQAPGFTDKELVKQCKVLIRRHVLNAGGSSNRGRGRGGGSRGRGGGDDGGGGGGGGAGRGRRSSGPTARRSSAATAAASDDTGRAPSEVARTPAVNSSMRTPGGYLSTSIAMLASDAAAGSVSFLENPLLALAMGLAAEAAHGGREGQQQQQTGGAAAERITALPDAELEDEWHMQGTAAAPYVNQSLSVAVVPLATRSNGAATYVRFSGTSKRGVLYASELAKDFALLATPAVPNSVFEARRRFLAASAVAWSPVALRSNAAVGAATGRCCLLAVATQSGHIQLWRCTLPSIENRTQAGTEATAGGDGDGDDAGINRDPQVECIGAARAHSGSITALSWAIVPSASPPPAAAAAAAEPSNAGGSSNSNSGNFFLPRRLEPGDTLVLATAGQDGGIKLWVTDPWAATASDALSALGAAVAPDQRQTMCLDMCAAPASGSSDNGWRLMLGAGKELGGVLMWQSAPFDAAAASPEKLAAATAGGKAASIIGHGKDAVTGVVVDPWAPGAVTCCLGGTLATWRFDAASADLVPAGPTSAAADTSVPGDAGGGGVAASTRAAAPPARLNPRCRPLNAPTQLSAAARSKAPLLGVAASGNRLVVAAVRSLIPPGSRDTEPAEKSSMTYNRIAKGWLELCLAPSCSTTRPAAPTAATLPPGLRAALAALPRRPAAPASAFWDIASGVALAGWAPIELTADQQRQVAAAAPPPGSATTKATVDAARRSRRLGQQLLRQSEVQAQWLTVQQAVGVLLEVVPGGTEGVSLSCADPTVWRTLRACAALRWALLHLWQGPQQVARDFPAATSQLQPQIAAVEMLLVQRHIWRALVERVGYCSSGGGSSSQQPAGKPQKGSKGTGGGINGGGGQGGVSLPPETDPLARLTRLLMADWFNQQAGDPAVRRELLPLVAAVYPDMRAAPALPPQPALGREPNPFGGELPLVAVDGRGPAAAREAAVRLEPAPAEGSAAPAAAGGSTAELKLERCATTLRVCTAAAPWRCVLCARRYLAAPTRLDPDAAGEDVPRCLVCGVRLAVGAEGCGGLDQPSLVLGPPSRVFARVP